MGTLRNTLTALVLGASVASPLQAKLEHVEYQDKNGKWQTEERYTPEQIGYIPQTTKTQRRFFDKPAYEKSVIRFNEGNLQEAFSYIREAIHATDKLSQKVKDQALKVYKARVEANRKKNGYYDCDDVRLFFELAQKGIGDWKTYALIGSTGAGCNNVLLDGNGTRNEREERRYMLLALAGNKKEAQRFFRSGYTSEEQKKKYQDLF